MAIRVDRDLEWVTVAGKRRVTVGAWVSARGNVYVEDVRDPETQALVVLGDFQSAERISLYEAIRRAAGVCGSCAGQGRIVRVVRVSPTPSGRPEEIREKCSACDGTGKARIA